MNAKRKAVQEMIYKAMLQLEPPGKNKKIYEAMFAKMSDKDFDDYMKRIRSGEDVLCLYAGNITDDIPMSRAISVAKANNVKIFERIRMYDAVNDCYYYTPREYAVLQVPVRRMAQFVDHKLTIAEGDSRVDMLTGQVVKPDKGAGLSEPESRILHGFGFKNTLRELNKFRGGDLVAFAEYKRELEEMGHTTVDRDTGTKVRSAITLDLYYSGIHIESNVSGL